MSQGEAQRPAAERKQHRLQQHDGHHRAAACPQGAQDGDVAFAFAHRVVDAHHDSHGGHHRDQPGQQQQQRLNVAQQPFEQLPQLARRVHRLGNHPLVDGFVESHGIDRAAANQHGGHFPFHQRQRFVVMMGVVVGVFVLLGSSLPVPGGVRLAGVVVFGFGTEDQFAYPGAEQLRRQFSHLAVQRMAFQQVKPFHVDKDGPVVRCARGSQDTHYGKRVVLVAFYFGGDAVGGPELVAHFQPGPTCRHVAHHRLEKVFPAEVPPLGKLVSPSVGQLQLEQLRHGPHDPIAPVVVAQADRNGRFHRAAKTAFGKLQVIGVRDVLHRLADVIQRVEHQLDAAPLGPHDDVEPLHVPGKRALERVENHQHGHNQSHAQGHRQTGQRAGQSPLSQVAPSDAD